MRLMEILTDDNPKLRIKSADIAIFDKSTMELGQNLLYTMKISKGVGIAAPQVGINLNVIAIDTLSSGGSVMVIMVNPKIIQSSGSIKFTEGCLSFPGEHINTERFSNITVKFKDFYGNESVRKYSGIDAVAIQHEIDHLNGITFHQRKVT